MKFQKKMQQPHGKNNGWKKNPWLDVLVLSEGALHSWGASLALHSFTHEQR